MSSTINGSFVEGIPLKRGSTKVYAELLHIAAPDGKTYRPSKVCIIHKMYLQKMFYKKVNVFT